MKRAVGILKNEANLIAFAGSVAQGLRISGSKHIHQVQHISFADRVITEEPESLISALGIRRTGPLSSHVREGTGDSAPSRRAPRGGPRAPSLGLPVSMFPPYDQPEGPAIPLLFARPERLQGEGEGEGRLSELAMMEFSFIHPFLSVRTTPVASRILNAAPLLA